MPSVFLSHNHGDKGFVHRLAVDLALYGVDAWVDEAELNVGDSLLASIAAAIDQVDFLAAVLSPRSVNSSWVQNELEQAMTTQLNARELRVLPLLIEACDVPGFLRGKVYADFTAPAGYERAFARLLRSIGVNPNDHEVATDIRNEVLERLLGHGKRPENWHCIFCGWYCNDLNNAYRCIECGAFRPYVGGSATMARCTTCSHWSLAVARFCEWCGRAYRAA